LLGRLHLSSRTGGEGEDADDDEDGVKIQQGCRVAAGGLQRARRAGHERREWDAQRMRYIGAKVDALEICLRGTSGNCSDDNPVI
jgi:hypothetical protein